MTKRKTNEIFLAEVNEIRSDIEIIGAYVSNNTPIEVKHIECGHITNMRPSKILAGQGCGKCVGNKISKAKIKDNDYFKSKLAEKDINYIEVIGKYSGSNNKILVRHTECGHEYEAVASNILKGSGCPICRNFNKTTEKFSKELELKYPNEYDVLGEYVNNRTSITVKHKTCGYIWDVIPKDLSRARRCPKCNMSAGEHYINDYLEKFGYDFDCQYRFDDCKNKKTLPFDFAVHLNNDIYLIEFDGTQHFRKGGNWGRDFNSVIINDDIKNKFCERNNIKLLRIPYWWLNSNRIKKELDLFLGE